MTLGTRNLDFVASAAVLFSGSVWGLFWLPARYFDTQGLDGAWLSLWLFAISIAVVLPLALWNWRGLVEAGPGFLLTGLFTGSAFTLYTMSLVLTDVIHALLLFYISPAWATMIAWATRGEPITLRRLVALALAFSGLGIVLGLSGGLPLPRNLGDWLSLAAGMLWAYGSTRSNAESNVVVTAPVVAFTLGGLLMSVGFVSLPIEGLRSAPAIEALLPSLPWVALLSIAAFVPSTFALLWSTQVLDPGRVGILLMAEVVVGTVSAALLAGEPFGWREVVGALLIVGAGFVEVTGRKHNPAPV